jgi:hypothetical protein
MPDPISAIVGSSVVGAGASLFGSSNAADAQREAAAQSAAAQREAAAQSIAAQREMFDIGRADLAPYREGGTTAQNQLMTLLGIGGDKTAQGYGRYAKDFGMSDFTADPGYQFRLKTGLESLERSAAARGMGLSGAALKGITDYSQNKASDEYQNAFNRYQTNRSNQISPLMDFTRLGQASAAGSAAAANTTGTNLGNTYTGLGQGIAQAGVAAGNAQASGYLNQANAVTNALNQGMSSYMMNNYLNRGGGINPYSYGAGGYTGQGPFMSGVPQS